MSQYLRGGDEGVLDSVLHQFRVARDSKLFHDLVLMEADGPDRDVENRGDFLRRSAFRKHLHDFSMSRSQVLRTANSLWIADEAFFHRLPDLWCHVGQSAHHIANSPQQFVAL